MINTLNEPVVKMIGICKKFGANQALKEVDFILNKNEIVGLVGDNGAGKSTLIKILAGIYPADKGDIYIDEKKVNWRMPLQARAAGIETVYQDLALVNLMSMSRVFFLGKELIKNHYFRTLDKKKMELESIKSLQALGIELPNPSEIVGNLSGGQKQSVALARSIYFGAKLLILDEPTASLSIKESQKVLNIIKEIKKKGVSIIFITHNIYHVYSVADRFTILERGEKIKDIEKKYATPEDIIKIITTGKVEGSNN